MRIWDVYIEGKKRLHSVCRETCSDANLMCIFEECFGYNRHSLILHKDKYADKSVIEKFFSMINRLGNNEPLQYILGKWYFMGIELKVGEGVLIPRDDTEVLVREILNYTSGKSDLRIADLCSGSGAIAIALDKNLKNPEITAIELSKEAYKYLSFNIKNNQSTVNAINDDINVVYDKFEDEYFDIIVSNPPYIPSSDIEGLDENVKKEPLIALDGGQDGLYFYRKICENWFNKIKYGGILAVEIGIHQCEDVKQIFVSTGFSEVTSIKDINDIDRVIIGKK